jgi:hypothetical protein
VRVWLVRADRSVKTGVVVAEFKQPKAWPVSAVMARRLRVIMTMSLIVLSQHFMSRMKPTRRSNSILGYSYALSMRALLIARAHTHRRLHDLACRLLATPRAPVPASSAVAPARAPGASPVRAAATSARGVRCDSDLVRVFGGARVCVTRASVGVAWPQEAAHHRSIDRAQRIPSECVDECYADMTGARAG